jgi:hypothetical protein
VQDGTTKFFLLTRMLINNLSCSLTADPALASENPAVSNAKTQTDNGKTGARFLNYA